MSTSGRSGFARKEREREREKSTEENPAHGSHQPVAASASTARTFQNPDGK